MDSFRKFLGVLIGLLLGAVLFIYIDDELVINSRTHRIESIKSGRSAAYILFDANYPSIFKSKEKPAQPKKTKNSQTKKKKYSQTKKKNGSQTKKKNGSQTKKKNGSQTKKKNGSHANKTNGSRKNNYRDNRYQNSQPQMVVCPICQGTGRYNSADIFKSQMPCTGCSGQGQVTQQQAREIINYYSSQSGNNSQSHDLCRACRGTGTCPVCHGHHAHNYGGIQYCETCGNTGICKWCYGSGRQQYK